jgi:hypothetical protein
VSKGKAKSDPKEDAMEEDDEEDEEDDEDEDEEMEEDDDDEDEEDVSVPPTPPLRSLRSFRALLTQAQDEEDEEKIDPSAIISGGRRTRGVRVDYSSAEAMAKAGLKPEDVAADDDQ